MFEALLSPLVILLSFCTGTGILLHETKVDKVASLTLHSSSYRAAEGSLETTPHTHVERTSVDNNSGELRAATPRIAPRRDDKKFRLQKRVVRGFHAYDAYYLPA